MPVLHYRRTGVQKKGGNYFIIRKGKNGFETWQLSPKAARYLVEHGKSDGSEIKHITLEQLIDKGHAHLT